MSTPTHAGTTDRLTTADLAHFTGTERLYFDPLAPTVRYTDGIRHLRSHGTNWLVVDALIMLPPLLAQHEFVCLVLRMDGSRGTLSFDDGNGNALRPAIHYTYADCPLSELKMFCTGGVLMLASEY